MVLMGRAIWFSETNRRDEQHLKQIKQRANGYKALEVENYDLEILNKMCFSLNLVLWGDL